MNPIFELRHSIRKFQDTQIPIADLETIIEAGTLAPSGRNAQNWHFVLISNKEVIERIAEVIRKKNASIASKLSDPETFNKKARFHTLFTKAPHLLLVFSKEYSPTGLAELIESGAPESEIIRLIATAPGIQGVSAAMENIQLAAASMGYGGVWMTGPIYAASEIEALLDLSEDIGQMIALSPLGVPEESQKNSPPRKPLSEVLIHIK